MAKHFEVVVAGQYHALNSLSGAPTLKQYRETFILPSQEAALSAICKHLLSPRLKKVHNDFIRFRTHELVSITLKGYTPDPEVLQMDLMDMNLTELCDFCILKQITIDPFKHSSKDIFAIRTMVQQAYAEKRQAAKDRAEGKNAAEELEAATLRKANNVDEPSGEYINDNERKVTQNAALPTGPAGQGAGHTRGERVEPVSRETQVEPLDEQLPPEEKDPEPALE